MDKEEQKEIITRLMAVFEEDMVGIAKRIGMPPDSVRSAITGKGVTRSGYVTILKRWKRILSDAGENLSELRLSLLVRFRTLFNRASRLGIADGTGFHIDGCPDLKELWVKYFWRMEFHPDDKGLLRSLEDLEDAIVDAENLGKKV